MDFLTTRLAVIENDLRREGRLNQAAVIEEARAQIAAKDAALPVGYTTQLELKRMANGRLGAMSPEATDRFNVPLFAAPARETK